MKTHLLFAVATINILSAAVLFGEPQTKNAKSMNPPEESGEVIEILTLDIKPGRRDEFHKVYETQALPLLKKWNFDVVAYGPSLHDSNSYYVIRRFKSVEDWEKSENAYYSSDDWKRGPRDAIFALVDHFAYAVLSVGTWKRISAGVTRPGTDVK